MACTGAHERLQQLGRDVEQLDEGQYLPARQLATQIKRSQQREIATMEKLLEI